MTVGDFIKHFDMFSNKLGFQILPSTRAKYKKGYEMYFTSAKYRDCVIEYLRTKNDAIVFVITEDEAIKHGLIKGE